MARRIVALVLVLALVGAARALGGPAAAGGEHHFTAMALGFALLGALLAGSLAERAGLPRLTGYLLLGIACGPFGANLVSSGMAQDLKLLNGAAVALIAFVAGLEMSLRRLRGRLFPLLAFAGATIVCVFFGLLALVLAMGPFLPFTAGMTFFQAGAVLLVFATVLASFSPTVTIAVVAETRAKGPLTDLVMATVVLADLALIVSFALSTTLARRALAPVGGGEGSALAHIAWEVFGSLAVGVVAGLGLAAYLRWVGRGLAAVVFTLCLLVAELGEPAGLSPLLVALAAGLFLEAAVPSKGEALKEAIEQVSLPVLVVFFVAAGASLHLDALARLWPFALVLAEARAWLARAGTGLGRRLSGIDGPVERLAWMGLVSQAGVTLGLAVLLARQFPGWGTQVEALIVALIALHEVVGPILFQRALRTAGEIGRAGPQAEAEPEQALPPIARTGTE